MLTNKDALRLSHISKSLYGISKEIRILRHLKWPKVIEIEFFKKKSEVLPVVEYPNFNFNEIKAKLKNLDDKYGDTPYDTWLKGKASQIKLGAKLLQHCGQKQFFQYSAELYGTPKSSLSDGETTSLDIANKFEAMLDSHFSHFSKKSYKNLISSIEVKNEIEKKVQNVFGIASPEVIISDELSAKATASSKRIKIKRGARFTKNDIEQLFNHEAIIHVATTLNGKLQKNMKILGANYGRVTKTQEGLAVFSELITGCIDINRMYRISDRVIAINMAIDGANFIDIYRFFLKRAGIKSQAFEDSRRVFRGGIVSGGIPFTKDIVYLDGLIRVHNLLKIAISKGRTDIIETLFYGKIGLDDIPILLQLKKDGLILKPKYLPDWVRDMNYLVSYFMFSNFVGKMNYDRIGDYYDKLF
tara:strand:- start:5696 stop:6940 length:1245 start_codon:yes stop_codon:yes gene_type:complete